MKLSMWTTEAITSVCCINWLKHNLDIVNPCVIFVITKINVNTQNVAQSKLMIAKMYFPIVLKAFLLQCSSKVCSLFYSR